MLQIRLESKGGRHSSIVFCTNGVLLRVLIAKGSDRLEKVSLRREKDDISNITHIIVVYSNSVFSCLHPLKP